MAPRNRPSPRPCHALGRDGTETERTKAASMLGCSTCRPNCARSTGDAWLKEMLTGEGEQRRLGAFCKGKWSKAHPEIGPACLAEAERVWRVEIPAAR